MLYEVKGQVWRVVRGADPQWFTDFKDFGVEPKEVHPSEWAWAQTKFTHIIENNKTVNDLTDQVQDLLVST